MSSYSYETSLSLALVYIAINKEKYANLEILHTENDICNNDEPQY